MRILRFFAKFFRGLFFSAKVANIVTTSKKEEETIKEPEPTVLSKEQTFFSRKNNLVEEFAYDPKPIYSSNLEDDKPVGYQLANGAFVKAVDGEFPKENFEIIPQEQEDLLSDDVELLEGKMQIEKQQNKTYEL